MGNWISQEFHFKNGTTEEINGITSYLESKHFFDREFELEKENRYGIIKTFNRTKNYIPEWLYVEASKKYPNIKMRIHFIEPMLQMCGVFQISNGIGYAVEGEPKVIGEWKFENQFRHHQFDGSEERLEEEAPYWWKPKDHPDY
jgi:hypothetical protein